MGRVRTPPFRFKPSFMASENWFCCCCYYCTLVFQSIWPSSVWFSCKTLTMVQNDHRTVHHRRAKTANLPPAGLCCVKMELYFRVS